MKKFRLLTIMMFSVALFGIMACSEEQDALTPEQKLIEELGVTADSDPHEIRMKAGATISGVPTELSIDTSQYAIHFRDRYGDYFYFNNQLQNWGNVDPNFKAYDGRWVSNGHEYKVTLIYNPQTKTIALACYYLNNWIMLYHCRWQSNNYFVGSYDWLHVSTTNKNRVMYMTFLKGAFPDMNG